MLLGISLTILKFLIRPIALSTWIRNEAILRVVVSSLSVNWLLVFIGGMFKVTFLAANRSAIVKPRSAITESPGSRRSNMPLSFVNCRSEMFPPWSLDTNEIAPEGVTATRVLWFLYEEKVNCWACGLDGACINISVASIIRRKKSLNVCGIHSLSWGPRIYILKFVI